MAIRTFQARTVGEALAEVKRALGPDAIVLHTRTATTGGFFGIGARPVTEITATDDHPAPSRNRRHQPEQNTEDDFELRRARTLRLARQHSIPSAPPTAADSLSNPSHPPTPDRLELSSAATNQQPQASSATLGRSVAAPDPEPAPEPKPAAAPNPLDQLLTGDTSFRASDCARSSVDAAQSIAARMLDATASDDAHSVESELAALQKMVRQVLHAQRNAATATLAGPLADTYARLIESGLQQELAERITDALRRELAPEELEDTDALNTALLDNLAAAVNATPHLSSGGPMGDGRPLTIALVGPTGVGKTTTVAKLAASYKLRFGCRVGLVTCDTYRIAAVDQLRTYANIIGIPVRVALDANDVTAACNAFADRDVIIIDTAGRSQRDTEKLAELNDILDAADPHERHLVLSAAADERVTAQALERFDTLKPDHVIFTKLDEAVAAGVIVNTLTNTPAKLSFITTGQEVPDEIELATPQRIASLVLDTAS